jgi:hypothetical protein
MNVGASAPTSSAPAINRAPDGPTDTAQGTLRRVTPLEVAGHPRTLTVGRARTVPIDVGESPSQWYLPPPIDLCIAIDSGKGVV